MSFTWSPPRNESGRYFLNGTFNFSNGIYVAVGMNSDKKMNGPIIICAVNISNGRASCNDYWGSYYSITVRDIRPECETNITDAWQVNGTIYITFEKPVIDPNLNLTDVNINGFGRWIFARGKWYPQNPDPTQHEADQQNSYQINFLSGTVEAFTSREYVIVLVIACVSVALASIALSLMRALHMSLHDKQRLVLGIVFLSCYCIIVVGYIMANYVDYLVMIISKSFYRAVGDGAVLCFASLMFPVTRRVFLGFFGIPPERAIKYHIFSTLVLIVVVAVHAIGMWKSFGTSYMTRWREKDGVSVLPGLIAFVLIIAITIPSLLRNTFSYRLHRAMHYLYVPCIFFTACHATALAYGLAPAAIFFFLSFIHRKFAVPLGEVEDSMQCAVVDEGSKCITLDFVKNDYLRPGSWYMLSIPEAGPAQHPFFVCRSRQTSNCCFLRFIIKDTRASTIRRDRLASTGWTGTLYDHLKEKKPIKSYMLDGPYGLAEVDPFNYGNFIFVAGGIGITPLIHMLQIMSLSSGDGHDEELIGAIKMKANILFMWVIPNTSLLSILAEDISSYRQAIANASQHLKLAIKVWVTGSQPLSEQCVRALPKDIDVINGCRPKFSDEFQAFEKQQTGHFVKTVDERYSTLNAAAMYLCGPKSMVHDARAAVKALPSLVVDTCEYEFAY